MQKFVDCRTKDVTRRELYIVEGDSALGSVKQGRDSEFQAIMPVRGRSSTASRRIMTRYSKTTSSPTC